jgi:hypothetical protein
MPSSLDEVSEQFSNKIRGIWHNVVRALLLYGSDQSVATYLL